LAQGILVGFYKQVNKTEKPDQAEAPEKPKYYAKKQSVSQERKEFTEELSLSFMEDWESLRVRHRGQKEIIDSFFLDGKKYPIDNLHLPPDNHAGHRGLLGRKAYPMVRYPRPLDVRKIHRSRG